jgi:hypothetical protein
MPTKIALMVKNYRVDVTFVARYVCGAIRHQLHTKDFFMISLREKSLLILGVYGQSFSAYLTQKLSSA